MKSTITVFILLGAAVCAPGATKKKPATPAPQAVTIPKDAVPNADGTSYLYTDKQGKKWVYAKTPFGIIKNAYSDAPAAAPAADTGATKAIDQGETVKFERPSPFGTMSYEKKKSDLTDDERRVLAGSSAAGSSTSGSSAAGSSANTSTAKPQ
jgi:hypothetical protein